MAFPLGCSRTPTNLQDCLVQATTKSSETAILAASRVCQQAFELPEGRGRPAAPTTQPSAAATVATAAAMAAARPSAADLARVRVTGVKHYTSDGGENLWVDTYNSGATGIDGEVVFHVRDTGLKPMSLQQWIDREKARGVSRADLIAGFKLGYGEDIMSLSADLDYRTYYRKRLEQLADANFEHPESAASSDVPDSAPSTAAGRLDLQPDPSLDRRIRATVHWSAQTAQVQEIRVGPDLPDDARSLIVTLEAVQ